MESMLREMDGLEVRRREISVLIEDVAVYWGESVGDFTNPEFEEFKGLRSELEEFSSSLYHGVVQIHNLGGYLKSHRRGLVDFYSVRDGRTVFPCWRRRTRCSAITS